MFCEGRQFEKSTRRCKHIRLPVHHFFKRLTNNSRQMTVATSIDKQAFLGAPFFANNRFFVEIVVPEGTPKLAKIGGVH